MIESIQTLAGDDAASFLQEIVGDFLTDAPSNLKAITTAGEQQDPDALRKAAHRLRSSSASLGAERLASLCQALEQSGVQGVVPAIEQFGPQLQAVFDASRVQLLQITDLPLSP